MENLLNLCCTLAYEEVSKSKGQLAKLGLWSNIEQATVVILITIYFKEYFESFYVILHIDVPA